jgi:hypothetical protein
LIIANLTDFEGCQSKRGEGGSDKPETNNDLWFGPAGEVEMVMDGSAAKEAFAAGIFEIANLEYDAEKLYHKDTADDEQENFVSGNKRPVSHSCAEGQ